MGYSNGGNGSWYFAEKHSDLFTAAIPMASAYPIKKKISIPLYVIHGAKDELFKVDDTRKWVNTSKEAGSDIILSINENLSHFEACAYVEELRKGGEWLQELWNDK